MPFSGTYVASLSAAQFLPFANGYCADKGKSVLCACPTVGASEFLMHPYDLQAQRGPFRDNNMGVEYKSTSVESLQKSFQNMCDL